MPMPDFSSGGSAKFPTSLQARRIFYGSTISKIRVYVTFTGVMRFWVTGDGGTNWEEITRLVNNTSKQVTLLNSGTDFRYKAIANPGKNTISYIEIEDMSATN
jgi:hypothetical protein